ncbi:MAG TPA: hypothetical protein VGG33_10445 [Polyangia bacterium]
MTRLSRRWSMCLALVAAGALGCASGAPAGTPALVTSVVDDRDPVSLLPAAVDSILTVDLVTLRGSAFAGPFLKAEAPRREGETEDVEPAARGSRTRRGFDELIDVDAWVFARLGATGGERAMLELARGRFDRERVRAAFRNQFADARTTTFGTSSGMTTPTHAVVFLSEEVLAFGPPWALRAVGAVMDGKQPSARQEPWLKHATTALAEVGPGVRPGMKTAVLMFLRASPAVKTELQEVVGFEMEVDHLGARVEVGDEARAYFDTSTTSKPAADELAGKLREALEGLRGRPSVEALGLGPVVRRADVLARGARVVMGLRITSRERAHVASKLAALGELLAKRRDEARAQAEAAADPASSPAAGALPP